MFRDTDMALRAKLYITCVVAAAAGILLSGFAEWHATSGPAFLIYLVANMLAAALKVTLPGLPNTMSAGFLLLLAATMQLSQGEVVVIAATSAVVQCLWKPKRRP